MLSKNEYPQRDTQITLERGNRKNPLDNLAIVGGREERNRDENMRKLDGYVGVGIEWESNKRDIFSFTNKTKLFAVIECIIFSSIKL